MKKCLFIAPLEAHATVGRLAALASTGFELHVIDVSNNSLDFNFNQYPFTKIASYVSLNSALKTSLRFRAFNKIIEVLRSFGLIPQSRSVLRFLSKEIDRVKPDLLVTYYGSIGIYFARLVKIINNRLPLISILNLIPSYFKYSNTIFEFLKEKLNPELKNYKSTIGKIDFIICASVQMREFVSSKYNVKNDRMAVIPDFFPKTMNFKHSIKSCEQGYSGLIFLGAPERWGGRLDDINDQFLTLAQSGIPIHSANLSKSFISMKNIFSYPHFKNDEVFSGGLSTFAHQFSASIITYGIKKRHQRFNTTLPTRFFMSLSSGIPIVVRADLFDAVEAYVEKYKIGFSYRNVEELKKRLSDKREMAIFRENSIKHSKEYFAESQGKKLRDIFKFVILNQGGI